MTTEAIDPMLLAEFKVEAEQHLAAIEAAVVAASWSAEDAPVDLLFRSFHSVKGLARVLDDAALEALNHAAETVLGTVRAGRRPLDGDVQDALIAALDENRVLMATLGRERVANGALLSRLGALADHRGGPGPDNHGAEAGPFELWRLITEDADLLAALIELGNELLPRIGEDLFGRGVLDPDDIATLVHAFGQLKLAGVRKAAERLGAAALNDRLACFVALLRGVQQLTRLSHHTTAVPLGPLTLKALAEATAVQSRDLHSPAPAKTAFNLMAAMSPDAPLLALLARIGDAAWQASPAAARLREAIAAAPDIIESDMAADGVAWLEAASNSLPEGLRLADASLRSTFIGRELPSGLAEAFLVPDTGEAALQAVLVRLAAEQAIIAAQHRLLDGSAGLAVLFDPGSEDPATFLEAMALPVRASAIAGVGAGTPTKLFAPVAAVVAAPEETQVRVPIEVLDRLFGRVGEFFSIGSWLNVLVFDGGMQDVIGRLSDHSVTRAPEIGPDIERLVRYHRDVSSIEAEVNRLVSLIHESTLGLRVIPLDSLVARFPRMIRDTARETGKSVRFESQTNGIKIDKGMSEMLADPLMHMLRNAVDHGTESPETRRALGKAVPATLRLDAVQNGNRIHLTISDDGRGIDVEAVRRKAVALRLVSEEESLRLAPQQVARFIFAAGFSTSSSVSTVSGRGVGMDVVLVNITRLGGRVDIETKPDVGTTFHIDMPLSAAIQPMLLVETSVQTIGFPEAMVSEATSVALSDIQMVNGQRAILFHGRFLPIFELTALLRLPTQPAPQPDFVSLVVCEWDGRRIGIEIHRILRRHEMLIRETHPRITQLPGIGGVTTLGFDRIVLVVDPDDLFQIARRTATRGVEAAPVRLTGEASHSVRAEVGA
jgi:two-component system chemotaxis sensor kinase CheA